MNNKKPSSIDLPEITTVASGAGVVFIGMLVGTGLKYIYELIVARNLGPELFGLFFLGVAVFRVAEMISTLGLHRGVVRYVALFHGEKDAHRVKGTILLACRVVWMGGIIVSVFIVVLSKPIALSFFQKIDLTNVLKFIAIAVPFSALTLVLVYATQGFKKMRYTVYVRELTEPSTRIVLAIILFSLGLKFMGVIASFVASFIVGTVLASFFLIYIFPEIKNKHVHPTYESKRILRFSWPLLFAEFFNCISIWINILMIGLLKTSEEVGIYSAAHRTSLLGLIVILSFNAIFAPIISDLYNRKEFFKLERLYKIITKWILLLSFPIFLFMAFSASRIMSLFGDAFQAGAGCLQILCIAQFINAVIGTAGMLIMMSGRSRITLLNNIILLVTNVSLNLILIPRYGIQGAAISLLVSISIVSLVRLIEVFVFFKIHPFRVDFYKPLLAGAAAIFCASVLCEYMLQSISSMVLFLLFRLLCFLVIYVLMIFLMRLSEEDWIILQRFRKIKVLKFRQHG